MSVAPPQFATFTIFTQMIKRGDTNRRPDRRLCAVSTLTILIVALRFPSHAPAQTTGALGMEQRLQQRVFARPEDSSGWRLLGRAYLKRKAYQDTYQAIERAVTLDPLSAAAHYDMGRVLAEIGRTESAVFHFRRTAELVPDSEYAQQARKYLDQIGEFEPIVQAGYEIQTFDGSRLSPELEKLEETTDSGSAPKLYRLRFETGVLYNSNVALTPLSRELRSDDSASLQGFFSPDLQLSLIDRRIWRTGTTFRGTFNFNEGHLREFNLQSYRPGLFVESFHFHSEAMFAPRIDFEFTHDEFDGATFGNRHALVTSLLASWNDLHSSFVYWSVDNTDFLDDGVLPSVTSQDGWTNALGFSHDYVLDCGCWKLFRAGMDWTSADARGSDFRYQGVSLFAEAVLTLAEHTDVSLEGGWGYRDYPDFEFTPSRNENVWRGGAELRRWITENVSVAVVFNYNRFASKNPLFDAERFVGGLVTTTEY